ncbi:hypothetical protein VTI74DRAFT_3722 [Chaetomium olivicolor]
MWPMSHALYPGLNNNPRDRPTTADSDRTWYGNNRKSFASASSLSRRQSIVSFASETPGEDLGDLINRSRRVLSALSLDAEGVNTHPAPQTSNLSPGEGSRDKRKRESLAEQQEDCELPQADNEPRTSPPPIASNTSSGLATESTNPSSSLHSISTSPTSPQPSAQETIVRQSLQSLSAKSAPEASLHDGGVVLEVPDRQTESCTQQETDQSRPASHTGASDVRRDNTIAPSPTLDWECLDKNTVSIHEKTEPPDDDIIREEQEEPETVSQLSGVSLVAVTVALSAAVFLVAMDVNVIATAIPRITGEFRSLNDIGWYGSIFLMATCATQIPYGRIYTIFPAKWVFISAIFIFMLGSLVAALSPSSPVFIFGRAVQGVGTSGILSGGLIIMSQVVPLRVRPILSGVVGAMEGVAMISAPIIGGVLTDNLSWRWCFYINLPIGGLVLLVVMVCIRSTTARTGRKPSGERALLQTLHQLDILGAVTLLPPVVCTLLALHYAGNGGSWGDTQVILLFVLAFVLFCIFAYTQHMNADVAMIPFRLVKDRSVFAGFWFILCTSSALVVITYFLPLWLQTVKDTSAQQSGIGILPMLIAVIVGVLVSGALVSLIGYFTPFMWASSALMPVGIGLLTTITPDTPRAALLAYPALFGLGVGSGFQQPLIGVQAALPKADIPIGTSIIVFGQTIGAAIIIATGESVFENRLITNLRDYLGITNVNTQQLLGNGPSALQSLVTVDELPQLIRAVSASLTQTFYLALAMAILSVGGSIFMGWHSVKQPSSHEEEENAMAESV